MAAAFTGWSLPATHHNAGIFIRPRKTGCCRCSVAVAARHNAKNLFDGVTLPAGQSATMDMKGALDALFNHPNVALHRQGTDPAPRDSNPSPAYLARVSACSTTTARGARDLKRWFEPSSSTPKRAPDQVSDPKFGKQREPVIRFANFLRLQRQIHERTQQDWFWKRR